MRTGKMKVEIWSDIVCPSCYIGKRKLEGALLQLKDRDNIEIIWRSFQLEPNYITNRGMNLYQFLEEKKGMSREQVRGASKQITDLARQAGLTYNLEQAIPANSFRANQLSHLAKHHNLQHEAEEALFKAYFTDGKNIDNIPTLIQLGSEIGLQEAEVTDALEAGKYADEVLQDITEATRLNITSVPTIVLGKRRITGVQQISTFLELLELAVTEWKNDPEMQDAGITEGRICKVGENCL